MKIYNHPGTSSSGEWHKDSHVGGHGTHVAGITALRNDKGVRGITPDNSDGKFKSMIATVIVTSVCAIDECVTNGNFFIIYFQTQMILHEHFYSLKRTGANAQHHHLLKKR